jgi:hypothetical protein
MPINDVLTEIISKEGHNKELTPYLMFKYAIKTEITRKYYERRLRKFFDFIEFEMGDKGIYYITYAIFDGNSLYSLIDFNIITIHFNMRKSFTLNFCELFLKTWFINWILCSVSRNS